MQYTISGEIAQSVRLDFEPNETAWASNGTLMTHSSGLTWALRVPGGLGGAISRTLAGEGVSLTYLQASQPGQYALLAADAPGHIAMWNLADGPVMTTRGSFLTAWGADVNITVTTARRAGAAFFGGAGLFLQRISGQGTVLIHGSGDFYERQLAADEQILVSTGNVAAFADSVDYDIQRVGGIRKTLFGGEGLFMTRLTGPGRVLLQTLKRTTARSTQSG
jgi:uncharacterized protein (TIGR00266 family)